MPLTLNEIRNRAHIFANRWKAESSERAEAQSFWNELLDVFGVDRRQVASYEKSVRRLGSNPGRIDLFWPSLLLAEHKSAGEDMEKATLQAFSYLSGLKKRELPRYIIVSDFQRFKLFDLDASPIEEFEFTLPELPASIEKLSFLAGYTPRAYKDEDPINIKAAEKLGDLYDALKENGYEEHSLKVFLVRLLFILFAEDTGIFHKDQFRWCLENKTAEDGSDTGRFIMDLFAVLDEPETKRQKNLDEDLTQFRYINGSLFEENLRSPSFDTKARETLLELCAIRWNEVSPAIFGSMFQSAMNKAERRQLGAHYTSEKNILKLINGLFLDELKQEFDQVRQDRSTRKKQRLQEFQQKLRSLKFLDPACGCGNFLVIAYRELRLLETALIFELMKLDEREIKSKDETWAANLAANKYIEEKHQQARFDTALRSVVDVDQFYGIELEELPVQIARVALWLTDHQMNMLLAQETGLYHLRLPLKSEPHIIQDNALRMDWNTLISNTKLRYILGNPPFVGDAYQTAKQKADMEISCSMVRNYKSLDFVCGWYIKAAQYIQNTGIKVAFVSTNSITQGEQVGILWSFLLDQGLKIHFAHRTFKWTNEARGKAAVFVVIIGFANYDCENKVIIDYETPTAEPQSLKVTNINPYLIDFEDLLIFSRTSPLCASPAMTKGSQPTDGGYLIFKEREKNEFLEKYPAAAPFIRKMLGSKELINGNARYCLWLHQVSPEKYRSIKGVMERLEGVRNSRASSTKPATQRMADYPSIFTEIRQPATSYIGIPEVSSEKRLYLPFGYLSADVIATNKLQVLSTNNLFIFGVIASIMHMAWMRQVCGRLEGRYDYSATIVYNNFPWPESPPDKQMEAVEQCAQVIIDTRQPYLDKGNTLADLYDPNTMPQDLLKAHQTLDKAVDACYGRKTFNSELERVTFLFGLYKNLIQAEQETLLSAKKSTQTPKPRKKKLPV